MKKIATSFFLFLCLNANSQTNQNINKTSGTVSNPINQIDSIRFNLLTNQMEVVLQSGVETHPLSEITNVTFSTSATNCSGDITSVTDIDGNVYPVVEIGNQCWTKENLKTTRYADGSVIPNVTDSAQWIGLTTAAWANFDNSPANDVTYGKLYNWYTVADPRNVCPAGWHVPTDAEWITLTGFLGGEPVAGDKMKTTTGWQAPNTDATNESGFSGLPGGIRYWHNGTFNSVGYSGGWWGSSEYGTSKFGLSGWMCFLFYNISIATCGWTSKQNAYSVRCLRD